MMVLLVLQMHLQKDVGAGEESERYARSMERKTEVGIIMKWDKMRLEDATGTMSHMAKRRLTCGDCERSE